MDVVVWLRSLGLGQYEAAFRENEIDETVLPNLPVTWALVFGAHRRRGKGPNRRIKRGLGRRKRREPLRSPGL